MSEELKGRRKQIRGKIREEEGTWTDDKTEQLKGKIEQAEGKVREDVGRTVRKIKNKTHT